MERACQRWRARRQPETAALALPFFMVLAVRAREAPAAFWSKRGGGCCAGDAGRHRPLSAAQ